VALGAPLAAAADDLAQPALVAIKVRLARSDPVAGADHSVAGATKPQR
jgi:hypothetical protein